MAGRKTVNPDEVGFQNQGKNFGDLLINNSNGGDLLVQLLNALGIQSNGDITGTDRKDWNKQLLDTLVSHQSTLENRQYNEALRDEQRIYDNPMSQLARLMGAGISRDQAIQMLTAGGSGSGGSGVPYSDPSAIAEGIAPSQSDLNHAQAVTAKLNTGLGFVQAATGLVSLGLSAAQVVPQITMLKNQEYLSSAQRKAFDASSSAFNIISSSGTEITKDTFGSVTNVSKVLNDLATAGNATAKSFIDQGGLNTLRDTAPYSLPFLNQMYKNEREPEFYTKSIQNALAMQEAQTNLYNCDANKAVAEIAEINELAKLYVEQQEYVDGQTALLEWHSKNIQADTRLKNATANQIELSNKVEKQFLDKTIQLPVDNLVGSGYQTISGADLIVGDRFYGLLQDLKTIHAPIGTPEWEIQIKNFMANQENMLSMYQLELMYNAGELNAVDENKDPKFKNHLMLCRAAERNGYFSYVNSIVNAETASQWKAGPFGGNRPSNAIYELNPIRRQ